MIYALLVSYNCAFEITGGLGGTFDMKMLIAKSDCCSAGHAGAVISHLSIIIITFYIM